MHQLYAQGVILTKAWKKLELSMAYGQAALRFGLPWTSFSLLFLLELADDLPGPLSIWQV